jgi:hypothetical protein
MAKYLSFGEAASRLGCDNQKVRQLVIEDKSLRATRITPNGLVLSECGLNGHFPYDLDFNSHLSSDGEITCDTYRLNAIGETEKTQTLFVGYLRVESAELQRFLSEQTLFIHDDDTLDEAALSELAARGTDAAELARLMLTPAENMQSPATANGMTTQEIGAVFDGLPFSQLNWPKRVSGAKWLNGTRLSIGIKGGAPSIWCPLRVAQAIHKKADKADKAKTLKTLNSQFKSNPALAHWKDDWDNFYSMFSDSD